MSVLQFQGIPYQLSGGGVVVGATTMTINDFYDCDGNPGTTASFGAKGYGTVQPNALGFEEAITFTGVTDNGDGTWTLTGISHQDAQSPYAETSGFARSHPGASNFIISNTAGFYQEFANLNNSETVVGKWTFPQGGAANAPKSGSSYSAPSNNLEYASKKYVDDTAFAGASLAAVIIAGTAGETLAAGQGVYFKESDQRWWKWDADAFATTANIKLGIAQGSATAGVTVNVNLGGLDSTVSGLVAGTKYYVSGTAAGFTATPGAINKFVGWAVSATQLIFQPGAIEENFAFGTSDAALAIGDWVYFKTSNQRWAKTDADAAATANGVRIGVVQTTASGAAAVVLVRTAGIDQTQTGLSAGSRYYLSGTTGAITTTPGAFPQFVGTALSTTQLYLNPNDGQGIHQWMQEVYGASSGGTDTYAITVTPSPVSYFNGMSFLVKLDVANTGPATLNVNGIGAVALNKYNDQALVTNDLEANQIILVTYNSTGPKFQVQSLLCVPPITSVTQACTNGVTTRAGNAASGAQTIAHGLGTTPTTVTIVGTKAVGSGNQIHEQSTGVYNGSTTACVYVSGLGADTDAGNSSTNVIVMSESVGASTSQVATIAVDSTNITLTWTKAGSPNAANINIMWEAKAITTTSQ